MSSFAVGAFRGCSREDLDEGVLEDAERLLEGGEGKDFS